MQQRQRVSGRAIERELVPDHTRVKVQEALKKDLGRADRTSGRTPAAPAEHICTISCTRVPRAECRSPWAGRRTSDVSQEQARDPSVRQCPQCPVSALDTCHQSSAPARL